MPIPLKFGDSSVASVLRLNRDHLLLRLNSNKHQAMPKESYDMERLLISTVDVCKSSLCPVSEVSGHLLRVMPLLLKIMIAGIGEPNLVWANPAAVIPLRLHAFATFLQLLGSSTLYFSKRGVTQLDGTNKWNLISLSRVVALVFDEGSLFGSQAEEVFNPEGFVYKEQSSGKKTGAEETKASKETKRRRHVRSNFEFFNSRSKPSADVDIKASGDLADLLFGSGALLDKESNLLKQNDGFKFSSKTLPHSIHLSSVSKGSTSQEANGLSKAKNDELVKNLQSADNVKDPIVSHGPKSSDLKIDTVSDFRSALEVGTQEAGGVDPVYEGTTSSGARAAMAMITAFGGAQVGSRRWMTAPAPGLATIREDSDGDEDASPSSNKGETPLQAKEPPLGPLDALDTELVLRPSGSSVKQMRVPKVKKSATPVENGSLQSVSGNDVDSKVCGTSKQDSDDIATGESFLDVIGRSLALG